MFKKYTLQILGASLSLSDWRHIAIAFKRKHCTETLDLYEGHLAVDNVFVRQAGHSRITEDRVYGLSADALLGPSEDLIPRYMFASTKWQVLFKAVPGKCYSYKYEL